MTLVATPPRPPAKKLPRNVWILGIVSLLMDMSSEIYHALMPAFLTITLGMPMVAVGAIDGIAEGTANISKLASGALSDRQQRRKPWVLLGYGLGALSKPLFPLANCALPLLGARFIDRVGKGIRGAPRDAMIADDTPPELRGRAFGLRQSLDTVGAFLAPIAAVALMWAFSDDIRAVFWIAVIPAALSFLFLLTMLKESERHLDIRPKMRWAGFKDITPGVKRLLVVGFLFGLARFSESFLILKALDVGVGMAWSPLVLALFNLAFLAFAYPAGALSDRIAPRHVLLAGIALLALANFWLARSDGLVMVAIGVVLWGAHMALTQGIFARMLADEASDEARATSFGAFYFVSGIAALLSSLAAGLLWDRSGAATAYEAGAMMAVMAGVMLTLMPKSEARA